MRRWQLVSLLSICILVIVLITYKPDNSSSLIEPTTETPKGSMKPTDTLVNKEEWLTSLSNSDDVTISTMEDGMQRTYKPADRLFYNDASALLGFYYRNIPNLSQSEINQIVKDLVVKTKVDGVSVPFTVIAFNELSSQGISIQIAQAPKADLIVQFHSLDSSTTKEFTFEYTPLFTYDIHSPEYKEADYYAKNPGTYYRVTPDQVYTFQVHFSLEVNQDDALNLLQNQFKDLDWTSDWKNQRDLTITLRTHQQDMYKKFLINFQGIKSTEGYVLVDYRVSLHGVITEMMKYESIHVAIHVATGEVRTLFHTQPRYQSLDVSADGQYYLAKELQDDFQGEFSTPTVTLLDAMGNVLKHFGQVKYPHWLADGQSFIYVSGDSILSYIPATQQSKLIWTSPYKDDKTIFSTFDSLELDPTSGRFVASINHLPGTAMDIGNVDLYLFANINDNTPRKVGNVSRRGNSSFTFQFDGTYIFYSNNFVVSDGSHWDNTLQFLSWENLKISDLNGFTNSNGLWFLKGGEIIYQKGDSNNAEWYRYDLANGESKALFIAEHGIDAAWWIGKGQYIMHDFTGTYTFNIQNPQIEKISILPKQAEIVGSSERTIIYLQNPDPMGSM